MRDSPSLKLSSLDDNSSPNKYVLEEINEVLKLKLKEFIISEINLSSDFTSNSSPFISEDFAFTG